MSDDDAAKEQPNTGTEATAKADRPQDSTAADVTAKVDATQPEATPPEATPPAEKRRGSWLPIAAAFSAGVLLVAAVTAIFVFWTQSDDRGKELDARDSATRAACDFGKAVGSYDAKNLDTYFKQVNDLSTGEWAQFFGGATDALKQAMVSVQARSKIDEIHCAWESGNDSEANVVVMITQEQTNAAVPQPDKITLPGVAHMQKKGDKWLVAKFDSPVTKSMGPAGPATPGDGQPAPAPGAGAQANQAPAPSDTPTPQPGR
ncbi:hypothetical protein [Nocardia sp. NPDC051570]|uniref:hypothetical protein n=1 Tax=Nocardia sp. NPDC051570 TaxID=3364324 RepID=UPI0037930668